MGKRSNGEGTFCKRSDGRWMGQVTLDTEGGYKCKLRSNGTSVPPKRNGYSILNGTKYRFC